MSARSAPPPDITRYAALPRSDQRAVLRFLTSEERQELRRQVQLLRKPTRKKSSVDVRKDLSPAFQQVIVRALAQPSGASRYAMTQRAREALQKVLGAAVSR